MSGVVGRSVRAAVAGAVAGAAGTAAMDLVWYRRYRRGGGTRRLVAWETSEEVDSWQKVSDPGRVAEKVLEAITGHEPPDRWARPANNLVHWMTGVGWGAQFGLVRANTTGRRWQLGLLLGPAVWLSSYIVLPLLKIYKPIWKYDAKTLAKDLSAHMAYGLVTAAAFSVLSRA